MNGRREFAILVAALGYSIASDVLVDDLLTVFAEALAIPVSVPRIFIGGFGILAFYAIVVRIIGMIHAWPLRGTWVLRSDTGEYGIATFPVRRGGPTYMADLYPTREDVVAALQGQPGSAERCFARLRSGEMERGEDGFTVLYEIRRSVPAYAPRKGILDIAPASRTRELRGFWHSTAPGGQRTADANSGAVTFFRPDSLLQQG